jgi:N-methylhydantoinase A/oxoprolinase/acetone carboxylase beta subunit
VTDCNLLLGKLQPDHFPHVFGPDGNEPLDRDAVERRFAELTAHVHAATGRAVSPEEAAEGFLRIAVANMANAIKAISVRRGHDVTRARWPASAARAGSMPAWWRMRWGSIPCSAIRWRACFPPMAWAWRPARGA